MKTKKKLLLSKVTIANLDKIQMRIVGGATQGGQTACAAFTCLCLSYPNCDTAEECSEPCPHEQ